jgi:hypothetical protein
MNLAVFLADRKFWMLLPREIAARTMVEILILGLKIILSLEKLQFPIPEEEEGIEEVSIAAPRLHKKKGGVMLIKNLFVEHENLTCFQILGKICQDRI